MAGVLSSCWTSTHEFLGKHSAAHGTAGEPAQLRHLVSSHNSRKARDNGKLVVRVPSRPFRKRLTETYGELLQAVLVEVGMPDMQLEFVCTEPEPASGGAAAAGVETGAAGLRVRGSPAQPALHL